MNIKIEKAFEVVNYMATLSNQRRIILEELTQELSYYINGATFQINPTLISFTKITLEMGQTHHVIFIDENNLPIMIPDVQLFLNEIYTIYTTALTKYSNKYKEIIMKRQIANLVDV